LPSITQLIAQESLSKKGNAYTIKIKPPNLPSVLSRGYPKPAMCGISFAVVIVHSIPKTINCLMSRQEVKKNEAKTSMG
jgi:hypothetical protein